MTWRRLKGFILAVGLAASIGIVVAPSASAACVADSPRAGWEYSAAKPPLDPDTANQTWSNTDGRSLYEWYGNITPRLTLAYDDSDKGVINPNGEKCASFDKVMMGATIPDTTNTWTDTITQIPPTIQGWGGLEDVDAKVSDFTSSDFNKSLFLGLVAFMAIFAVGSAVWLLAKGKPGQAVGRLAQLGLACVIAGIVLTGITSDIRTTLNDIGTAANQQVQNNIAQAQSATGDKNPAFSPCVGVTPMTDEALSKCNVWKNYVWTPYLYEQWGTNDVMARNIDPKKIPEGEAGDALNEVRTKVAQRYGQEYENSAPLLQFTALHGDHNDFVKGGDGIADASDKSTTAMEGLLASIDTTGASTETWKWAEYWAGTDNGVLAQRLVIACLNLVLTFFFYFIIALVIAGFCLFSNLLLAILPMLSMVILFAWMIPSSSDKAIRLARLYLMACIGLAIVSAVTALSLYIGDYLGSIAGLGEGLPGWFLYWLISTCVMAGTQIIVFWLIRGRQRKEVKEAKRELWDNTALGQRTNQAVTVGAAAAGTAVAGPAGGAVAGGLANAALSGDDRPDVGTPTGNPGSAGGNSASRILGTPSLGSLSPGAETTTTERIPAGSIRGVLGSSSVQVQDGRVEFSNPDMAQTFDPSRVRPAELNVEQLREVGFGLSRQLSELNAAQGGVSAAISEVGERIAQSESRGDSAREVAKLREELKDLSVKEAIIRESVTQHETVMTAVEAQIVESTTKATQDDDLLDRLSEDDY